MARRRHIFAVLFFICAIFSASAQATGDICKLIFTKHVLPRDDLPRSARLLRTSDHITPTPAFSSAVSNTPEEETANVLRRMRQLMVPGKANSAEEFTLIEKIVTGTIDRENLSLVNSAVASLRGTSAIRTFLRDIGYAKPSDDSFRIVRHPLVKYITYSLTASALAAVVDVSMNAHVPRPLRTFVLCYYCYEFATSTRPFVNQIFQQFTSDIRLSLVARRLAAKGPLRDVLPMVFISRYQYANHLTMLFSEENGEPYLDIVLWQYRTKKGEYFYPKYQSLENVLVN
jgi:hypothetical protein